MILRSIVMIVGGFVLFRSYQHVPLETVIGAGCGALMTLAVATTKSSRAKARAALDARVIALAKEVARCFLFETGPLGENCKTLSRALIDGGYDVKPR